MCGWITSCETLTVPSFYPISPCPPTSPLKFHFHHILLWPCVFFLLSLVLFLGLTVSNHPCFLLARGHNQRMEFLGDSIMQLVATEYLFIHFPDHHEGHLTVRSNHLNHTSSHALLTRLSPTDRHVLFTSASCTCFLSLFHLCASALWSCSKLLFLPLKVYLKWCYSCAFVFVCVGDVFSLPSFLPINLWISQCQSGIHSLPLLLVSTK